MVTFLSYLLYFFRLTGIYLGPPKTLRELIRWPDFCLFLVTFSYLILNIFFFLGILVLGVSFYHEAIGENADSIINQIKPVTILVLQATSLAYMGTNVQNYMTILFNGKRLAACLDNQLYRGLDFAKWAKITAFIFLIAYSLIHAINIVNTGYNKIFWIFRFMLCFQSSVHIDLFNFISIYFMFINIHCLRQLHLNLHKKIPLETFIEGTKTLARVAANVEHFYKIISPVLFVHYVHDLLQISFNLDLVFFQGQASLFVASPIIFITSRAALVAVICYLTDHLLVTFDKCANTASKRLHCEVIVGAIEVHRLHKWQAKSLMLHEAAREQLQPKVYRVASLTFNSFVSTMGYAVNLAILLYQTDFF